MTAAGRAFDPVVFDLDGTLVDASEDIADAMNHALAEWSDRRVSSRTVAAALGSGALVLVQRCLHAAGVNLPPPQVDRLLVEYSRRYAAHPAVKTRLLDTAAAVLPELHSRGIRIGVCTNKRTSIARDVIDALGLTPVVGAVIGADMASRPKPDPRHLTETVAALGATAGGALYVGDTDIDSATAVGAGVTYAHVKWGHDGVPADYRIASFDDLLTII